LNDRGRTVVITTHYMDEAERLCDRVAVIDHGQVIALGPPKTLIANLGGEHVVEFTTVDALPAVVERGLSQLPGVSGVRHEGSGTVLSVTEPHTVLPRLMDHLRGAGLTLAGLTTRTATLEDVFVTLTGRSLRDGGSLS
jgi:ABC-2 type transport system ATP-binding protein